LSMTIKYTRFKLSAAAIVTAVILVTGIIDPAINQAYASSTADGRAMALSITSPLVTIASMDTGSLASSGQNIIYATPVTIQTPIATADGLYSAAMGSSTAQSQSAIGQLVLLPTSPNKITTYFAMAESQATCSGVSGSSSITSLTIAGQPIQVTGQPNQIVTIPGVLKLTINEQIISTNSITVNALHLQTADGTDVIISSAKSSVSCATTTSALGALFNLGLVHSAYGLGTSCVDYSTGGGWVQPPPNKGTFGFVAGYMNGGTAPRGNFDYHDHTSGMEINATDVQYYNCGPYNNSRTFSGDAEVNNAAGFCYKVYVQDNGEPGTTDYFTLWAWSSSTGCPADGSGPPSGTSYYVTGNYLGGGNLQVHT
jgi:hypothetical protein